MNDRQCQQCSDTIDHGIVPGNAGGGMACHDHGEMLCTSCYQRRRDELTWVAQNAVEAAELGWM